MVETLVHLLWTGDNSAIIVPMNESSTLLFSLPTLNKEEGGSSNSPVGLT